MQLSGLRQPVPFRPFPVMLLTKNVRYLLYVIGVM